VLRARYSRRIPRAGIPALRSPSHPTQHRATSQRITLMIMATRLLQVPFARLRQSRRPAADAATR